MKRVLLCFALACGPSNTAVDVKTLVTVSITPTPETLPYDPRSARLTQVSEQLAAIAGHPVQLEVDAALVPDYRSGFEDALGQALENIARDLSDLKEKEPRAFAHGAPLLLRVVSRYDAAARQLAGHFEGAGVILSGPHGGELVPRGSVRAALLEEYTDWIDKLFTTAAPDKIPEGQRAAYFEWLTDYLPGRGFPKDTPDDTAESLASSSHATRLLTVLRLAELDKEPKLSLEMRQWIFGRLSWFVEKYVHSPALVRTLPADCAFHRAEAGFVRWLKAGYPSLDEAKRLEVAKAIYVRSFERDRTDGRSYPSFAFPGIDRFDFGFAIANEWVAAGHKADPVMENIVCPHPVGDRGERSLGPRCEYDWYRYSLETEATRKRLVDAVLARGDQGLTEAMFLNVWYATEHPVDVTLAILRAVEDKLAAWSIGWRLLADERGDSLSGDVSLLEEARRVWIEHPDRHGLVLYLLAQLDRYDNGSVDWGGFAAAFGGPATKEDFASYLEVGPRSVSLAPVMWPSLGKGFNRSPALLPKLDAFVDHPFTRFYQPADPHRALGGIVARMCAEKNTVDLAAIRTWFAQRAKQHPGESFSGIADQATANECKPPPPSPPPKSTVRWGPLAPTLKIHMQQRKGGVDL